MKLKNNTRFILKGDTLGNFNLPNEYFISELVLKKIVEKIESSPILPDMAGNEERINDKNTVKNKIHCKWLSKVFHSKNKTIDAKIYVRLLNESFCKYIKNRRLPTDITI